jgi:hypothetical protein
MPIRAGRPCRWRPAGVATPVSAAPDEVEIRLPDDPRVPQPDDADPTMSRELGGADPAVGPGRSQRERRTPGTDGSREDADG